MRRIPCFFRSTLLVMFAANASLGLDFQGGETLRLPTVGEEKAWAISAERSPTILQPSSRRRIALSQDFSMHYQEEPFVGSSFADHGPSFAGRCRESPTLLPSECDCSRSGSRRYGSFPILECTCVSVWRTSGELIHATCDDYCRFYTRRPLATLGLGVGLAAILANTSLDSDFQDWNRREVNDSDFSGFLAGWKWMGEGHYLVPGMLALTYLGGGWHDGSPTSALGSSLATWSQRSFRSYLVGGPMLWVLQYGLGASRPNEGRGSRWRPFDDSHGASGHAFIATVPLLQAAHLHDGLLWKATFVGMSLFPCWQRIDSESHYLSQAFLGWWLAVLASEVVVATDWDRRHLAVFPWVKTDSVGVGCSLRW